MKTPHTKKSQACSTNGTRASGQWQPVQKPRPRAGPVPKIPGAVRRHRAQGPEALQLSFHPKPSGVLLGGVRLEACEIVDEAQ